MKSLFFVFVVVTVIAARRRILKHPNTPEGPDVNPFRGDDVLKVHMTTDFKYNAIEGKIREQGSRLGTFDYLDVVYYYEDHYHYKFQISGVYCPEALRWIEDMVTKIVELRATALRCNKYLSVPRKGDVIMYRRYNGDRHWLKFNTNVNYV
uniref:Uncharacterized protein n=1 Tax=Haemonchus contortus TaxID=6289 RepID=A0A7I4Y6B0_HAECO|nr:unnamed protein product [Haemonchus contortus]CDJ87119.1 unnamed protein product [Haemonchus contortus]